MGDADRLAILTVNIGSPSAKRAELQLEWLASRDDDVLVLTETCDTAGSRLIGQRLRTAGWDVRFPTLEHGQRGVLVACRVRASMPGQPLVSYLSSRAEAVAIDGAAVEVVGVYVPSRDESDAKLARKARFIEELVRALDERPAGPAVLIGDLNVLEPDHRPRYPFFRDWEYALYSGLIDRGWIDAYRLTHSGPIEHSWIGRDEDGFRFDHVFVSPELRVAIRSCSMLHETREQGLTDHSALALSIACEPVERLAVEGSLSGDPLALF